MRTLIGLLALALSTAAFAGYTPFGDIHWKAPTSSLATLPATGNTTGDVRTVLDTFIIYEWNGSAWVNVVAASAVTGPGSSTDKAIVRWNGAAGNVTQNSSATLSDAGLLTTANEILSGLTATTVPYMNASKQFTSSAVTPTELGYSSGVTSALCGINQSCTVTNKTLTTPNLDLPLFRDTTVSSKQADIALSGATTATKTTLTFSQSVNRVITFPDATDTLVGKATTDTLTNKTLNGNTATNLISGAGTFTFNTTGTITSPNATDTLVGKATTDTLTNKSISGSTNTLTAIPLTTAVTGQLPTANGGTGQNSTATFPTSGSVLAGTPNNHGMIVSGAAGTVTVVAPDASTTKLWTSGGASADPSWQAAYTAPTSSDDIKNVGVSATQSGGILTIALKQSDGSTNCSSGASACNIGMRSSTATTGSYSQRQVTAALSLALSVQTTVGLTTATVGDLVMYAVDSDGAGAIKLGVLPYGVPESDLYTTVKESDTATITNASPGVVTVSGNNYANGDPIIFTTSGALPTGLAVSTTYYVIENGTDGAGKFRLSASSGGATAINTSSAGSGTHTIHVAGNRQIVSDGYYTAKAVHAVGKVSLTQTAGSWGSPTSVELNPSIYPKWFAGLYINGARPDINTGANITTYTYSSNASWAGGLLTGSTTAVQIPCSGTNDGNGWGSCKSGNPAQGISFYVPGGGNSQVVVNVCHGFTVDYDVGAGAAAGDAEAIFSMRRTGNADTTAVDTASHPVYSGINHVTANARALSIQSHEYCVPFRLTTGTKHTFRIAYMTSVSGTINGIVIEGNANLPQSGAGNNLYWTANPL